MDDLHAISKYLEEKNLQVELRTPEHMLISKSGDAMLDLRIVESRLDYIPGSGENDFTICTGTLDETTLIIWNYFFAQTVRITDWDIALHRYPYWSLAQMQYRLANLVHITVEQLENIKEERQKRFDRTSLEYLSRLDSAETTQFICCGSHLISCDKLIIRRDMQEAYSVRLK